MDTFLQGLKNEIAETTLSATENGAVGYARHLSDLVTFFFAVGSMRNWEPDRISTEFLKAYNEDAELAMRMLFYIRDARGGIGERRTFRVILESLPEDLFCKVVGLVPEYGRWDDITGFLDSAGRKFEVVFDILVKQLQSDIRNMEENKSISLLAKWMPSASKVSKDKVRLARKFYTAAKWTEKKYRKTLSSLRSYLKVVECDMCANKWSDIDYCGVPSKANLNYSNAFLKHDNKRRTQFLDAVKEGRSKINVSALLPYEIVHAYNYVAAVPDESLEVAWSEYSKNVQNIAQCIVVRDGSGSMSQLVGPKSNLRAREVATSLAVLMAEHLPVEFRNRFITFSHNPQFVDLSNCHTLADKLNLCYHCNENANTDVEKVMDLVLGVAVKNSVPKDKIPPVVIVSDQEFDQASDLRYAYGWDGECKEEKDKALFERIEVKWKDAGYSFPKIVFWNVCSRTNTIPMQRNENGLILVSGFSPAVFGMVEKNGTPLDILTKALMAKRYDKVAQSIANHDD